jgi:CRP-like cAMP-binding protein
MGTRVVDILGAGGIFGEESVDDRPAGGKAVMLSEGRLLRLRRDQVRNVVRKSPMFSLKALRAAGSRAELRQKVL